jgi:hypothetical protein
LGVLLHGPFSITTRDRVLNSTRCKVVYLHRPGRGMGGGAGDIEAEEGTPSLHDTEGGVDGFDVAGLQSGPDLLPEGVEVGDF